jgi:hypothetical protein
LRRRRFVGAGVGGALLEGPSMTVKDTAVAIGIDLAVAAKHRVAVRNGSAAEDSRSLGRWTAWQR